MKTWTSRFCCAQFIVAAAASLLGTPLHSAVPDYPTEGRWSVGPTHAVEHWRSGAESILLAGEGTGLVIIDAAVPSSMTVLGTVDTGGPVWEIAISDDGQIAAVSDRDDWMTIIDIADRSAPTVLGRYEFVSSTQPWGVDLVGDLAFVAVRGEGLWVIDIADPAQMSRIGRYLEVGTEFVFDVQVLGDHAFLADDWQGVTAIDISDPAMPVFADRLLAAERAREITLDGTVAYISRGIEGISILDLSAAPVMTELGSADITDVGEQIYSIAVVSPDLIVCADSHAGLRVVDVSDPSTPVIVATHAPDMFDVSTDGATAFAVRRYSAFDDPPQLFAFDIDTSAPFDPPSQIGTLTVADDNVDVEVAGDLVLVANQLGGTFVVDASDASQPQTLARVDTGGARADRLVRVGNTLASVAFNDALGLVDISDPQNPVSLPDFPIAGGYPYDLAKIPGVNGVVVAAYHDGVRVINLTTPAVPVEAGFWIPPTGTVFHVDHDGDRIAAAGGTDVWILDASSLAAPIEWTSFTAPGNVHDIAIEGDHVYVATSDFSVVVWDVSVAGSPTQVASIDTSPTFANGLDIHAGRLYIAADAFHGLMVRDITDPTDPFEIATSDTPGEALGVAASDTLIAVADGVGGVEIWSSALPPPPAAIFADGFESGDTAEWTTAGP